MLYNGDAEIVLKTEIEKESIDLVVTSPPYGELRGYDGIISEWNDEKWKAIIKLLFDAVKPGGVVVWVVGDETKECGETLTPFYQAIHAKDCGFTIHDTMIYQKTGISFPDTVRYYANFEFMFVWSKGKPKSINLIKDRKNMSLGLMRYVSERQKDGTMICRGKKETLNEYGVRFNVWKIPHTRNYERKLHPATFPIELAEDHILSWSSRGDTVLDCFMGSGTTGVAAKKCGREFVGIELNEEYFKIAETRIKNTHVSKFLF